VNTEESNVGDHVGRPARDHRPDGQAAAPGPRRRAGELSRLVLEVLERAGRPLTPGEVLDRLQAAGAGPLAYTTVVTILYRLHAQGIAGRSRAGRAYAYAASAGQAQLAAQRMRRLLDAEDDRSEVLASFVGGLSARDERVLRELLGPDLPTGPQAGERPGPGR
jgi:predicted transcriptional regulator